VRRKLLPEGHGSILVIINNLGGLRLRAGDWAGAAERYEEVVRAHRERPAGDMGLATPLSNLSMAWARMGRLEEAIAASREAAALMANAVGPRSVGVTYPMQTTAFALQQLGRYDEAEQVHREVVDIRREAYGDESHPNVVFSVEGFAWFLLDRNRAADALPLADEAVAKGRRVFTRPHGYLAEALLAAGRARVELGRHEEAVALLRESLSMLDETGSGPLSIAQTQSLLGRALVETGHADEGLPLLRLALSYFDANGPPDGRWSVTTRAALEQGS
jgi:tetratricopeptide (TPR) repeat protein